MAPKRSHKVIASIENVLPRPGHKRAKIEDPVGDKVTAISDALADTQFLEIQGSAECREMLMATLPLSLKVPRSERHSFQAAVASMIGEILNSSKDKWEQKVSDAQQAVDSTSAERSSAATVRDEANDRLKEQQAVVTNLKEQEQQQGEAEKAAQQVLEHAEKEVREFEDVQAEKAKKLAEHTATYKDNFEAVQSPSEALTAKDQKMHLSKLTAVMKELSADASLVTAMQAAIKKMPAERGTFDSVAVEQVGMLLKKNMDALQSDLDSSDIVKAQKIEAQAQAQTALDSAKESHKESKENFKAATETLMARQTETKAALKTLVSKVSEADNAAKHHVDQQKGLDRVQNLVLMFDFLVDRDVMPEPEPKTEIEENSKVESMMEEAPAVAELVQAMEAVA